MSEVFTPTHYKLSIDDYHKLGEVGILNEDSRVELIEGELIQMPPIGGPHMWTVTQLNHLLVLAVGRSALVSPQSSVTLPPDSESQPDFAVVKRIPKRDKSVTANTADVLLIVEVSETSLRYDRDIKLRLYAKSGIPEFWVVDVNARQVEVYRDPSGNQYREKSIVPSGEFLHIQALPEARIEVAEIFA